jgi:uncharacterized membrane protein
MADFELTQQVDAPAAALFDYLSDVGNLPHYFAAMTSAEPAGGEAVHTTAEVDGVEREGEAWFRVDDGSHRIEWGSEGESDYHGSLEVSGDEARSSVTVSLHAEHGDRDNVEQGLAETLTNIKQQVERGAAPGPTS